MTAIHKPENLTPVCPHCGKAMRPFNGRWICVYELCLLANMPIISRWPPGPIRPEDV